MSLERNLLDSTPAIAGFGDDVEAYWFLDDLYLRVLTGEILDPDDAQELLVEYLDDEDDDELPEAFVAALEADADAATLELVRVIWESAAEAAYEWVDEATDTDRFFTALDELEDEDIDAGVFTDHADVPQREGQRGAVVLWVNAWEEFDEQAPVDVLLTVRGGELEDEVAAAFRTAGIEVADVAEGAVTVRLQWRHHVEPWADVMGADAAA
jgi:hypothetical protein